MSFQFIKLITDTIKHFYVAFIAKYFVSVKNIEKFT